MCTWSTISSSDAKNTSFLYAHNQNNRIPVYTVHIYKIAWGWYDLSRKYQVIKQSDIQQRVEQLKLFQQLSSWIWHLKDLKLSFQEFAQNSSVSFLFYKQKTITDCFLWELILKANFWRWHIVYLLRKNKDCSGWGNSMFLPLPTPWLCLWYIC